MEREFDLLGKEYKESEGWYTPTLLAQKEVQGGTISVLTSETLEGNAFYIFREEIDRTGWYIDWYTTSHAQILANFLGTKEV